MIELLAALALCPQVGDANPFAGGFNVPAPIRIACTPLLDGKIDAEEWDPLADREGMRSFFQWEPGIIYAAAVVPGKSALVISLDLAGDGWLVGRDNLEIWIEDPEQGVQPRMRLLDATIRSGPEWVVPPLLEDALKVAVMTSDNDWTAEVKLLSLGIADVKAGAPIGVRIDAVNEARDAAQPFWPRPTALTTLQMEKALNLPPGMSWRPSYRVRSLPQGDMLRVGLEFRDPASPAFARMAMRVLGLAATEATVVEQPFPGFDSKGKAFANYESAIAPGTPIGYRVLQVRLTPDDGPDATMLTSFQVADLVMFDVNLPNNLVTKDEAQIVRGNVIIRSQSFDKLQGSFNIVPPEGWTVAKGNGTGFTIYHSRGSYRVNVELIAPPGARGLFPLRLRADIGAKRVEQAILLPVR